jgi:GNAT superfamily N-acetyltransferase
VGPEIVIERVLHADVDDVVPLLAVQLAEHGMPQGEASLRAAVLGLVEHPERGALFVARREHRALGVAALSFTWTLEHGGKVMWIDELYVKPDARGAGIGTKMLEVAIAFAKSERCRAIDLEVDADHARVESLYVRHAFGALPRRRFTRPLT